MYHGMISHIEDDQSGRMTELGSFDTLKEVAQAVLRRGKTAREVIRVETEGKILYLVAGTVKAGGNFPEDCWWEDAVKANRYSLSADHPNGLNMYDDLD